MKQATLDKKILEVNDIAQKIKDSKATVVVEYAGLSVEEFSELRGNLRQENVEIKVIKNNIARRAFEQEKFNQLLDEISGPVAIAFAKDDVTAAPRVLSNFAKNHKSLVLKAGTMDNDYADNEQINELATLPNRDGMLSMLLSVLEEPIRGLAQTTSQIASQKEQ